ncbi:MAG: ABC transporter ATP-binding protein [Pseudomonadota bacterium]|nr:ABC transporter ATP-binding protein [Pseudomonadota bacterium]
MSAPIIAPVLSVRDLVVRYRGPDGDVCAVDGVSFDVRPGEVLGLAGESGSGKSTVAHAVLRILRPPAVITGGEVWIDGQDVLALGRQALARMRWRTVSIVLQNALEALNPVLTVAEQIIDTVRAHAPFPDRRAARVRAEELLALVGLGEETLDRWPHQLSGGQRQRVNIALALALKPKLVLMDEPTTALDVVVQRELLQRVLQLRDALGFSVLFITHDLPLLFDLADRVGVLYAGRMAEIGPARAMRENPAHPYTRGLLRAMPPLTGPKRPLAGIPGAPPDPRHPLPGCRYAPRCPFAAARCSAEVPLLHPVGAGWRAACHAAPGLPARPLG